MAATTIFPYHSIGDLTYDADIGDIILMVKAHHNPDDVMIQSALFNYYIGKILSYWDLTKDYLMSPQIIEDRRNRSFHATNILININISEARTNFDAYTQLVLDRINKLKAAFERDSRCDVIKISKIFSFISQVGCGSFNPRFKIYNANRILYPLPNVTGIFGINTYLYALIHGVNIIGVPVKAENFDYLFGCPWTFMMHDIDHEMSIRSLFKGVDSISRKRMKTIYNIIVTDPNLNIVECSSTIFYFMNEVHKILIIYKNNV